MFSTLDYTDKVYGAKVRNHHPEDIAYYYLQQGLPPDTVFIRESLHVSHETVVIQPHPNCEAVHSNEPEKWTVMSVRVFLNVDEQHREVVKTIGVKNRIVRVPIMEEQDAPLRPAT